ncbi:hypothetical protein LCGC14_1090190, partial [marine sediment metagenome]
TTRLALAAEVRELRRDMALLLKECEQWRRAFHRQEQIVNRRKKKTA